MDDAARVTVAPTRDMTAFMAVERLAWFEEYPGLTDEYALTGLPEDERYLAEIDGQAAGIHAVLPMALSLPDGTGGARPVPVAGLTWVGVHPDHRRRGVLSAMIGEHLRRTAEAGRSISALHASEHTIYRRFGYGVANLQTTLTLGRGTTLHAPGLETVAAGLQVRMVSMRDDGVAARFHRVMTNVAATQPGIVACEPRYLDYDVHESVDLYRGSEPVRVLFAVRDGVDVAAARLRRTQKWEHSRAAGRLEVRSVHGDPAGRLALLRRLLDFDLITEIVVERVGPDDPLWAWIGGPRGADEAVTSENLYIRPVDLPAALTARGYETDGEVVVEVLDAQLPGNAGRWRIAVAAGTAEVHRTDAAAELTLDVAALGGTLLGGGNLVALHHAGLLTEHRPGAVSRLWRMVRTDVVATPSASF